MLLSFHMATQHWLICWCVTRTNFVHTSLLQLDPLVCSCQQIVCPNHDAGITYEYMLTILQR